MSCVKLSLAIILPFLIAVNAADSVIDYSTLSPDAFKAEIDSQDLTLVKFYAPWCGHCKRLAPDYEEAATTLAADATPVPLAKVDCTNESGGKDICSQYEVQGYPTLKIFRNGSPSEYNDGRDAASIVKKMRSLAGPSSKELDSFESADKLYKETKNYLVIGIFSDKDDSQYKLFTETANQNRDAASFAHIFQDKASDKLEKFTSVAKDKSVKTSSIILTRPSIYRNKFEPDYLVYDSSDDLKDWILDNKYGLVKPRTLSDRTISQPRIVVYYNVDYVKDPKGTNYWRNRVLKVASQHKDSGINFAISNIGDFANDLNEFGISLSRDMTVAAVGIDKDGKKFAMKEKFSVDSFGKFVQDFLDGNLEEFMKSEDEPDNEGAGVKVAVGKNFEKLVTKSEKDIFIEFYAPWCGYCKQLAPIWEELGEKLKNEPGVDIVKLDATANDIPSQFAVSGYPTLYWYPKDTKTPVKYEGARELNDLLSYVAKEASEELKGFDRSGNEKQHDEL